MVVPEALAALVETVPHRAQDRVAMAVVAVMVETIQWEALVEVAVPAAQEEKVLHLGAPADVVAMVLNFHSPWYQLRKKHR